MASPPPSVASPAVSLRRAGRRLRRALSRATTAAGRPLRAVAFWSAVALPFLNVALLADGLSTTAETTAFLVVLAANVLALYLGRSHRQ